WLYGPLAGGTVVKPMSLQVTTDPSPTALIVGEVLFEPTRPHVTQYGDGQSDTHNVYEGRGYFFIPLSVPDKAPPGKVKLQVTINGQTCDKSGRCISVIQKVTVAVEVGATTIVSPAWTEQIKQIHSQSKTFKQWEEILSEEHGITSDWGMPSGTGAGILATFALALLAGLVLNIMPCVLPVIPLRLLTLLEHAGQSRRRFITLGLAFAGGIVLFFAGLAVANVVLKLSMQYSLKQADLFRHTGPVMAMILLLVALAANMFGAFTVTVPASVASARTGRGHLGAVGMGLIMAVLSTPCSFAIIAAVFTSAVLFLPLPLGSAAIILIGVGMAAPHAMLSFMPKVVSRLPKTGRWTDLFKQSVGFVFLLIAVWLLRSHMSRAYPAWVAAYGVVLAMCLWMWGSWVRFDAPAMKKWSVRIAATVIAVAAGWWMLTPPKPLAVEMRPFDAAEIAQARREGKIVLVKFTATWCPECKVLDMTVYNDPELAEAIRDRGVVAFKGDVTRKELPASKMLFEKLREAGPPLTVIFMPGKSKPVRLRGGLSKKLIIQKLDEAAGEKVVKFN
ncbi:MAG: thioredoxin family protein, partial [Phycisphaerae bacterium]|nr:thioredoxin family protein [Phycisphaerae bacterium]